MLFRTLSITAAIVVAGLVAITLADLFSYVNDAFEALGDGHTVESVEQPTSVEVLSNVLSWTDRGEP